MFYIIWNIWFRYIHVKQVLHLRLWISLIPVAIEYFGTEFLPHYQTPKKRSSQRRINKSLKLDEKVLDFGEHPVVLFFDFEPIKLIVNFGVFPIFVCYTGGNISNVYHKLFLILRFNVNQKIIKSLFKSICDGHLFVSEFFEIFA